MHGKAATCLRRTRGYQRGDNPPGPAPSPHPTGSASCSAGETRFSSRPNPPSPGGSRPIRPRSGQVHLLRRAGENNNRERYSGNTLTKPRKCFDYLSCFLNRSTQSLFALHESGSFTGLNSAGGGGEVKGDVGGQKIGGNAQIAENTIRADSSGCFRGALVPPQRGVRDPSRTEAALCPPKGHPALAPSSR